ncbi:SpaA isopeptide-forming pilin-related protein [Bengtsoniella intestinalis]|uniref:MSCRAMM family protein n=1 Tax=Bengtsoniella intestinalis TaxID=3073143 RepID=UPI00391F756B
MTMTTSKRWLSLFLVMALVLGLFSPITVAYAAETSSTAPTDVKVQYNNDDDWLGKYYSDNLKSNVNVRTIRSTYTYGGESVSSYAFCLEHGDGLDEDDTYTYVEERTNYAAAPFIAFMLTGARVSGWSDATIQSVQGWVNAVVWLTEAGMFNDPTDPDQITMAAEERVAALTKVFPSTEHTLEASVELLEMIVSGYNNGDYGKWSFYVYETNNSVNQNLMIADYTLEEDLYWGYVQLNKTDESGTPLSGAEFTVYEGTTALATMTTNSAGYAVSGALSLSSASTTLTVVETKAPTGYTASTQTYTVSVSSETNNSASTAAWVNNGSAITNSKIEIPTEYIILKLDEATGEPLAGATFRLKEVESSLTYDLVTNEDGVIELQWLDSSEDNYIEVGTYTVTETSPPAGYSLSDATVETITFERIWNSDTEQWEQNNAGQFVYENPKNNTIKFTKIDADGNTISGGTFEIYKDGNLIATETAGTITLDNLETGYYTFKEVSTPSGYVASSNPYASVYVDVEDVNTDTYYLSLINYEYPDIQIRKSDPTGLGLSGAVFDVQIDSTPIGQVTTNSIGVATITYAQYGEFLSSTNDSWTLTVTEVQAPEGFLMSDTNVITAEIQKGQTLATLEFVNDPIPEIQIAKIDSATGLPLAGAEFAVYIDGVQIGTYYSDDDGIVSLDYNDYGSHLDLTANSWVIKVIETAAPSGYSVSDVYEQELTVVRGQTVASYVFGNYSYPQIEIYKTDEDTNRALAGSLFKVSIDAQTMGYYTTGSDGKILISYADYYEYLGVTTDNEWVVEVEEIRAPSGYLLNADNTQTAVLNRNQGLVSFEFSNYAAPTIQIEKLDSSNDNQPISGAVFEVRLDTASLGSFVTDENGLITLTYEDYGIYLDQSKTSWTVTATELSAPDGYLMSDITTLSNEMILGQKLCSFTFTNAEYPAIIVEKRSSVTNELLEGATFSVTIDAAYVGSFTTDENGQFTITYDQYGGYLGNDTNDGWTVYVTETQAPDGYHDAEIDTQQAQMYYGQSLTPFVFVNIPRSDLLITKVDSLDGSPLEGVTFNVMRDTVSIGTFKTDANGEILIEDLEIGTYTVTEVDTIYGYVLNDTPQTVEVAMDDNIFLYTLDFENDRQPTLKVNKIDSITGDPILGALFSVTYQSSKTTTGEEQNLGTYYTDANGQFELLALDEGWYTVTELEPADGYSLKEPLTQELHLSGNENATMTFENIPLSALVIKKVDAVTGEVLQGAKFSVSYLAGTSGTGGTVIGNYETSVNGTIVITGLEAGTYIIQETQAPSGYIIDDAPETVYISGETQDVVMVEFENQPDSGLIITKLDSSTGEPLADAVFKVTTDDGTVVGTGNGYYTTDATGTIHIPNLATDTYIVTEVTAPSGYVLDGTPQTVKLIYGETHNLTFYNDPTGGLIIQKLDSVTGEALSGAVFKVTTSDGTYVANYGGTVSSNGLYTTNAYGQIHIVDLEPDTYIVTEVSAPDGYILDSTSQTVRIYENDTQTLTFENTPLGGLTIIKKDADDGSRIKGVEFEVREMDGAYVGTYTTNSSGVIYLTELDSGWYTITEIEAADGYLLDSTPHNVEVVDGETTTITIKNTQASSVLIHKVDSVTGKGIYGVQFLVSDSKNNPIGVYTSDQNGYVFIDSELTDGKYYAREIEAADGYILDTTVKTFYVEYGGTTMITWENTPILGQIQVTKYAGDTNQVTGVTAGSTLSGATFEISDYRTGAVVGYITSDSRGIAASDPLPLGRYIVTEVSAPAYYQLSSEVYDVTLEYEGQIIKLASYNYSAELDVSITKTGVSEVLAGSTMTYNFTVANTSNVALDNFYWHDRIPTDVTTATTLTTGTYNQWGYYQILYKTNYNDYRVLSSNLLTTNNYSFSLNTIPLMSGEVVTDIYFDFGTVPAGFQSVTQPTLSVSVNPSTTTDYNIINRADVGGQYETVWITKEANWVTIVRNLGITITLPKTGY